MSRDNHYVFDTNVIVSVLLFNDSVPGQAFFLALEEGALLLSREQAEELRDVLSRDKFDRHVTREERERLLVALIREAELVTTRTHIEACRAPDDDLILDLAVDGDATLVVTGDKDLLVLRPFRGIPVVTPRDSRSRSSLKAWSVWSPTESVHKKSRFLRRHALPANPACRRAANRRGSWP